MSNKYKHLFFDLDHTLWDFETNAKLALKDVYHQYKLEEKGVHNFEDFFTKYSFHNHRLWDRYTKGFIKQEELKWKRMWLTLLDYKVADENLSRTMAASFLEILPTKNYVFDYCIEVLEYLQNKEYQLHLITNGFINVQHNKLTNSNLDKYFIEVITSEGSNSIKPNKEIFEYALQKAKASVQESIMIGDNQEADIQGGINAGLDTIFVNHINAIQIVPSTYTVKSLKELTAIF